MLRLVLLMLTNSWWGRTVRSVAVHHARSTIAPHRRARHAVSNLHIFSRVERNHLTSEHSPQFHDDDEMMIIISSQFHERTER